MLSYRGENTVINRSQNAWVHLEEGVKESYAYPPTLSIFISTAASNDSPRHMSDIFSHDISKKC